MSYTTYSTPILSDRGHVIRVARDRVTYGREPLGDLTSTNYRTPEIDHELAKKFTRLAKVWRNQKGPISSVARKAMLPSYQTIIALGPPVIPLILNELQAEQPDHWFWALEHLTEENPVPDADRGNMNKMAEAWVRWGKLKGYL